MQHCAGFISAESLYIFRAPSAHHQEYLKTGTAAPGTCVIVAGRSSHHLIRAENAAVPVLNTPDDGRLTPETCRVTL